MKKITLMIGILLAVNILFAQGRRGEMKNKRRGKIEAYQDRLDLSEGQLNDIKEIKAKYKPEMEEIRNDQTKTRSDKMRAAADVVEKQETEINEILNQEQQEEWKKIRAEIKEHREAKREKKQNRGDIIDDF